MSIKMTNCQFSGNGSNIISAANLSISTDTNGDTVVTHNGSTVVFKRNGDIDLTGDIVVTTAGYTVHPTLWQRIKRWFTA